MPHRSIFTLIRSRLVAGLLTLLPAVLTVGLIVWLWRYIDGTFQPLFEAFLGRGIPGLGLILTLFVLYLVGAIVENTLLKPIVLWSERLIQRIPFAGMIYSAVRQAITAFHLNKNQARFSRVVFIQFPRPGVWALGFVTTDLQFEGSKRICVFVPTSPLPSNGFVMVVKEEEVISTDYTIEEAAKFVVSAGALTPGRSI